MNTGWELGRGERFGGHGGERAGWVMARVGNDRGGNLTGGGKRPGGGGKSGGKAPGGRRRGGNRLDPRSHIQNA